MAAVQKVVHDNLGSARACYENGLSGNPTLAGRVSIKFIIDRTGAVSTAQDQGSNLSDSNVVQCIVRAFGGLSFPAPEGGIVTVVYPLVLTSG